MMIPTLKLKIWVSLNGVFNFTHGTTNNLIGDS